MQRLLGISAGITAVAFVVAGICRHAKHGAGLYLGNVAWFTLLAGVAVTVALAAVVAVQILRSRRSSLAVRS
jgi:hypothetical protein